MGCTSFALLLLASPASFQQVDKLNPPLAISEGYAGEDAVLFTTTPDGVWTVYVADSGQEGTFEVFSVPSDGSGPSRKLSGTLPPNADAGCVDNSSYVTPAMQASPTSDRVVFCISTATTFELYSAPVDGSAAPVALGGGTSNFRISPNGGWVVFVHEDSSFARDLYSVPIDGSAAPTKISGTGAGVYQYEYRLTSAGRVVFMADREAVGEHQVYSALIEGGVPPVKLNGPIGSFSSVFVYNDHQSVTPDGSRVLFAGDVEVDDRYELYSAPCDGSAAAVKLNGPLVTGGDVVHARISPDGSFVVYWADQTTDGTFELRRVPIDGSAGSVVLASLPAGALVAQSLRFDPTGSRVLYVGGTTRFELFSVRTDASAAAVKLSGTMISGGGVLDGGSEDEDLGFLVTSDGARAIFVADRQVNDRYELYSAPIDGSAAPTKLNPPITGSIDVDKRFGLVGGRVVFRIANDLWSAPADGSSAAVQLDVGEGDGLFVDPRFGAHIVYWTMARSHLYEVFSAPFDGSASPIRLNEALDAGPVLGDVRKYAWSADGGYALYLADQDDDERVQVHSVRLAPGFAHERLSSAGLNGGTMDEDVVRFESTPSGRVVYYQSFLSSDIFTPSYSALFGVPTDGTQAPVQLLLNGGIGAFAPGERLLSKNTGDDLLITPIDGSSPATQLSPAGSVDSFALARSPDRVVFAHSDGVSPPGYEVLVSTLDGSSSIQIDSSSGFLSLRVAGQRAAFVTQANELASIPLDGSAGRTRLNPVLPAGREVEKTFLVRPDGSRVVYLSDQDSDDVWELYGVPTAGGTVVKLNGPLVAGGDVGRLVTPSTSTPLAQISPDGTRVVYEADQLSDEVWELFSAPVDGSQPAVRLNADMVSGGDVRTLCVKFTPDGTHVVFAADQDMNDVVELYVVPIDGSQLPTKLTPPMVAGGGLFVEPTEGARDSFALAPGGRNVFYLADQETDELFELYSVPIDGSAIVTKRSGTLVSNGDVKSFAVGSYAKVLYRADAEIDEVFELFLSELPTSFGSPRSRPVKPLMGEKPLSGF